MKKIILTTIVAFSAIAPPLIAISLEEANAATPSKPSKSESDMKRIIQNLVRIENDLNKVKPTTSENSLNNIQKKIDRSRKLLSVIPKNAPGYKVTDESINEFERQLHAVQDKSKGAQQNREADLEKMKSLLAQTSKEHHFKFISSAEILSSSMAFMNYQHPHMNRKDSITQEYKNYATQFPIVFDKVSELLDFFDNMDTRDIHMVFDSLTSQMVSSNGKKYVSAKENLDNFGLKAIQEADAKIDVAGMNARNAILEERAVDVLTDTSISSALNYLENSFTIYKARPDADSVILQKYKTLEAKADKEINDVMLEALTIITKNNVPVPNAFNGSDRKTIEQMVRARWKEAYPGDVILQVRIKQSDWVRRREPGWRNGYLIMLDYSILTPYVVVKEKDGLASQWGMIAEKDHTLQDKISISFGRLRTKKLEPLYTVLQSNLD